MSLPNGVDATPLVIYLPGLGESSEAGELWRAAWSSAGYAVLSVQLLAIDEEAWTSPFARSGEFRKLGADRFGAMAARQRLRLLFDLVIEGKRRSLQSETPWVRVDWNRLAIAGYDVGAYTAMIAAGEHLEGVENGSPLAIRAIIALSPFTNLAADPVGRRYGDIRIPVLSVTSNADADPLGMTDSPNQRAVPFDHMHGPDKYLLKVRDLSHTRLGGGLTATTPDPAPNRPGSSDLGPRRGGGRRTDQDARDDPLMERPRPVERAVVRGLSAGELRMRVMAAQAISTAFLDMSLKDDVHARDWLANDASRWLDSLGTLSRK